MKRFFRKLVFLSFLLSYGVMGDDGLPENGNVSVLAWAAGGLIGVGNFDSEQPLCTFGNPGRPVVNSSGDFQSHDRFIYGTCKGLNLQRLRIELVEFETNSTGTGPAHWRFPAPNATETEASCTLRQVRLHGTEALPGVDVFVVKSTAKTAKALKTTIQPDAIDLQEALRQTGPFPKSLAAVVGKNMCSSGGKMFLRGVSNADMESAVAEDDRENEKFSARDFWGWIRGMDEAEDESDYENDEDATGLSLGTEDGNGAMTPVSVLEWIYSAADKWDLVPSEWKARRLIEKKKAPKKSDPRSHVKGWWYAAPNRIIWVLVILWIIFGLFVCIWCLLCMRGVCDFCCDRGCLDCGGCCDVLCPCCPCATKNKRKNQKTAEFARYADHD